jgi:hypothetical protein
MTTPESGEPLDREGQLIALVMKLSGDVAELSARVGEQETETAGVLDLLDQIEAQTPTTAPATEQDTEPGASDDADRDEPPSPLDLRGLVAWVRENVALVLERKIPQSTGPSWCRRWWLHPEALVRFNAARESWLEACVSDGNAKVVYLEHLDHQLGALMAADGPFSSCTVDRHREGPIDSRLLGHVEPGEDYYRAFEQAHNQLEQTQPIALPSAHGGHQ